MIIKALGLSRVQGVFTMTRRFVMNHMGRNRVLLLAFFDIFDKVVTVRDGR
jgi:hypothetical protein